MNIFTYFQEKRREKKEAQTQKEVLEKLGLRFPIFCKLHGIKSPDHQGAIAQSRVGDHLQIVHVPSDNRPYNVCAYSVSLNRILGYIEEELAVKLVCVFGNGFCRDGEIEQITGGEPYKYRGCNVRLMDTQYFMEDCDDFSHLYSK